jgi:hypothetical protein
MANMLACRVYQAGEGIRTPDRLITNQLLYQLSYASLLFPAKKRIYHNYMQFVKILVVYKNPNFCRLIVYLVFFQFAIAKIKNFFPGKFFEVYCE